MDIRRIAKHVFTTRLALRRRFSPAVLQAIEDSITASEQQHGGEIRFVIETSLSIANLIAGSDARQRAQQAFSDLRVWDTAANNGVVVYVLLAEQRIEIVADRGYNGRVSAEQWASICRQIETEYQQNNFRAGSVRGIEAITDLLRQHFPHDPEKANELGNTPLILK